MEIRDDYKRVKSCLGAPKTPLNSEIIHLSGQHGYASYFSGRVAAWGMYGGSHGWSYAKLCIGKVGAT